MINYARENLKKIIGQIASVLKNGLSYELIGGEILKINKVQTKKIEVKFMSVYHI